MPSIKFLYIEGCPNAQPALELLRKVLEDKNVEDEIEVVRISSEVDAIKYNFLGSPSIQIDGKDIEAERRGEKPVFGCRLYKNKENPGIPPVEMIINALP